MVKKNTPSPKNNPIDEQVWDVTLRPKKLDEYIGQKKLKANLCVFIGAAKKRAEPLEHILLHGSAGLGKTTLAYIIAKEMNANVRVTSGPAVERAGDLAAILTNLQEGDVLFIDEIHRLNKNIEEILYPAMEEYALDIIVGKGPGAKTLRLNIPRFTLIAATTKLSQLSSPLRDRFGFVFRLNFYEHDEIAEIIKRSANILKVDINHEAINEISLRSRQTPRIANRMLKRVRDYAQMQDKELLDLTDCNQALKMLEIDDRGLDATDRKILSLIIDQHRGGPVGLNTIAAAIAEEISTIEEIYEPFLMQIGFLHRTPRGRVVTESGYRHLNRRLPKNHIQKLNL